MLRIKDVVVEYNTMTIAVISDLHDNIANWQIIQKIISEQKINVLINCGDTCAPAMLKEMSNTFSGQIHTVFGNVADRDLEEKVAGELPNVQHYGDRGHTDIEGKKIFFNHLPEVAEQTVTQGAYDLVCHGHTHLKRWEKIGTTYILNPGTAGGMFQYPSFATVNLSDMTHQFIEVKL